MDWLKLGIAAIELLADLAGWLKQRQWYQQGVADANAQAQAAQQARITLAQAARAAPDPYASGTVRDPYDRG